MKKEYMFVLGILYLTIVVVEPIHILAPSSRIIELACDLPSGKNFN
jgi:hypothetical protein